jgi:uncharacterized protein with LGFP repeats
MRKLVGRALISMATTVLAAALLAPSAAASPIGDAEAAMMAAWEKAGGDSSPLGARKGDVYPVGDGFVLDFDGGKMFYTTDTGAKFVFGPILDKYESLGGPAGSDLGFPTINEVPGLAGPDSRVATFSASDKPVIFWTPDHGAFVVRGALNTAWDKLGSSGGVLGAPIGDETYDGEVTSQKFSGGEISWNRKSKEFTTTPPALADQLKGLQVAIDPAAAINMAWRAAGGATGPLGAKQGGTYPIGGDGIAQNFAGGKVFFSPATGANALESDVLAKYESLGGPVGSDLGFPTGNESDGGSPSSRIATFSAADKPAIFWTQGHGAFVVRGAMKAAWDKLRGPSGKLGAPVSDQAADGDVISQQFTGGKISWNRAKNSFTTDPSNLAPLLSGLQVPGQNQPSTAAMPSHGKKFTWHRWWLLAAVSLLVLVVLSALAALGRRRRRRRRDAAYEPDHGLEAGGYEAAGDGHWGHDDATPRVSWSRGAGPAAGLAEEVRPGETYADEAPSEFDEDPGHFDNLAVDEEDPDAVDTDSIPVVSEGALPEDGYPDVPEEAGYSDADYDDVPEDVAYLDDDYAEAGYQAAAEPDAVEVEPDDAPEAAPAAPPEAIAADDELLDTAVPAAVAAVAAGPRSGRHAALDDEDLSEFGTEVGFPAPAPGRPTIHLPLDDPYQAPDGYPIKANASFGLYYTPSSPLYHDTLAEFWLSSEEVARANGFTKAD